MCLEQEEQKQEELAVDPAIARCQHAEPASEGHCERGATTSGAPAPTCLMEKRMQLLFHFHFPNLTQNVTWGPH